MFNVFMASCILVALLLYIKEWLYCLKEMAKILELYEIH
jgi:hypothetical protein